jgi:hypothetical protein
MISLCGECLHLLKYADAASGNGFANIATD